MRSNTLYNKHIPIFTKISLFSVKIIRTNHCMKQIFKLLLLLMRIYFIGLSFADSFNLREHLRGSTTWSSILSV